MDGTLGGHGAGHEHLVWVMAAVAFAIAAVGLIVAYRRLSRRVELERAERLLADEIDALDDS